MLGINMNVMVFIRDAMNLIMKGLYGIYFGIIKAVAWVLDMLTQLFFIFSGMTPVGTNVENVENGIDKGKDILNFFIGRSEFRQAYIYLCGIALILVAVFTIGKIIKQDYFDRSGPRSKAPIFRNVALSFIAFICIIPVFMFLIQTAGALALAVMRALGYKGGGIGSMLFNISWEDGGETIREAAQGYDNSKMFDPDNFGWYAGDTFYQFYWDTNELATRTHLVDSDTMIPEFYWYVFLFTGFILIVQLGKMMLSMVSRLFKLIALFLVAPSPISQIVLDDGLKFKRWKDSVLQEALKVVGCVMCFMIFMLVAAAVPEIDLMKFAYTSDAASGISLIDGNNLTSELSNSISSLYYGGANKTWVDSAVNSLGQAMILIAGVGAIQDMDSVLTPVISGGSSSTDMGNSGKAIAQTTANVAKGALELGKLGVSMASKGVETIAGGIAAGIGAGASGAKDIKDTAEQGMKAANANKKTGGDLVTKDNDQTPKLNGNDEKKKDDESANSPANPNAPETDPEGETVGNPVTPSSDEQPDPNAIKGNDEEADPNAIKGNNEEADPNPTDPNATKNGNDGAATPEGQATKGKEGTEGSKSPTLDEKKKKEKQSWAKMDEARKKLERAKNNKKRLEDIEKSKATIEKHYKDENGNITDENAKKALAALDEEKATITAKMNEPGGTVEGAEAEYEVAKANHSKDYNDLHNDPDYEEEAISGTVTHGDSGNDAGGATELDLPKGDNLIGGNDESDTSSTGTGKSGSTSSQSGGTDNLATGSRPTRTNPTAGATDRQPSKYSEKAMKKKLRANAAIAIAKGTFSTGKGLAGTAIKGGYKAASIMAKTFLQTVGWGGVAKEIDGLEKSAAEGMDKLFGKNKDGKYNSNIGAGWGAIKHGLDHATSGQAHAARIDKKLDKKDAKGQYLEDKGIVKAAEQQFLNGHNDSIDATVAQMNAANGGVEVSEEQLLQGGESVLNSAEQLQFNAEAVNAEAVRMGNEANPELKIANVGVGKKKVEANNKLDYANTNLNNVNLFVENRKQARQSEFVDDPKHPGKKIVNRVVPEDDTQRRDGLYDAAYKNGIIELSKKYQNNPEMLQKLDQAYMHSSSSGSMSKELEKEIIGTSSYKKIVDMPIKHFFEEKHKNFNTRIKNEEQYEQEMLSRATKEKEVAQGRVDELADKHETAMDRHVAATERLDEANARLDQFIKDGIDETDGGFIAAREEVAAASMEVQNTSKGLQKEMIKTYKASGKTSRKNEGINSSYSGYESSRQTAKEALNQMSDIGASSDGLDKKYEAVAQKAAARYAQGKKSNPLHARKMEKIANKATQKASKASRINNVKDDIEVEVRSNTSQTYNTQQSGSAGGSSGSWSGGESFGGGGRRRRTRVVVTLNQAQQNNALQPHGQGWSNMINNAANLNVSNVEELEKSVDIVWEQESIDQLITEFGWSSDFDEQKVLRSDYEPREFVNEEEKRYTEEFVLDMYEARRLMTEFTRGGNKDSNILREVQQALERTMNSKIRAEKEKEKAEKQ